MPSTERATIVAAKAILHATALPAKEAKLTAKEAKEVKEAKGARATGKVANQRHPNGAPHARNLDTCLRRVGSPTQTSRSRGRSRL